MKTISLFTVLSVIVLNGCGSDDPQTLLNNGKSLYEEGKFNKAKLEIKSAIQVDKDLPEAYYYLALINENHKNYRAMLQNLERAVRLKPDYIDARLRLGKLLLKSGDIDKAELQMEKILEYSSSNKEGLVFKALLLNRQGKKEEARAIVVKVLEDDPSFVEAVTLNAMLLIHEEKYEEARDQLKPLIDEGSKDVPLYMVKILLDAKKNDYEAVINDYKGLIEHYPDNEELKYALVKIYVQTQKQQEAEQLLLASIESKPDEVLPKLKWLELLSYYDLVNGESRAKVQLDKYLEQYKNDPEKMVDLSAWMLQKKMYEQGQAVLENINVSGLEKGKKVKVLLTLAKLAFQQRDLKKADLKIDEILAIKDNYWPAKILQAKILAANKNYDEAIVLLNKIAWANTRDDEPIALIAQIHLIQNDPLAAEQKFREAIKLNPANTLALQYLLQVELKKKNYDYANELAIKALIVKPKDLSLMEKATQVKLVTKDWKGAEYIISVMQKHPKGKIPAQFLLGKTHQLKNECGQAVKIFKQLLKNTPNHANSLTELARCYEVLKQRSNFENFLVDFIALHPKNINAQMMLSDLYLAEGKSKKAEAVLQDIILVNPQMPQVYVKLSRIYRSNDQMSKAIAICEKGLELLPNNLAISLEFAIILQVTKQYEEAIVIYENLNKIHPDMNLIINNLAALLIDQRSDEASHQQAFELASRFEKVKQPYFLDTYAWTLVNKGELTEAVSILEDVNLKVPNEPVFKYHLGAAYVKQGNVIAAKIALNQALELGKKKGGFDESQSAQELLNNL